MSRMDHELECIGCHAHFPSTGTVYACPTCGELLEVTYNPDELRGAIDLSIWKSKTPSVWKYEQLLPIKPASMKVTLGEGGTNLHKTAKLGKLLGLNELNVKNEGENPTGSFKDRGMTVGVTRAVEVNSHRVICASTGNTSASLSAYAAKASLESIVIIPRGKIALGKLTQAIAHGARIIEIEGYFDDALRAVLDLVKSNQTLYLLNSVNPYRIEGQKTLAYEIWDQLEGDVPDTVIVPVGNAGNISAIWKGFQDLEKIGLISRPPRMIGIQAQGAAPLSEAFKAGRSEITPIQHPQTVATAIKIGAPASWKKALMAVKNSRGMMETVTDDEILESQKLLARLEGLFVEPASASSVAGLKKLVDLGAIGADEKVTCVVTGHGLKDPDIVYRSFDKPAVAKADMQSLKLAINP